MNHITTDTLQGFSVQNLIALSISEYAKIVTTSISLTDPLYTPNPVSECIEDSNLHKMYFACWQLIIG